MSSFAGFDLRQLITGACRGDRIGLTIHLQDARLAFLSKVGLGSVIGKDKIIAEGTVIDAGAIV